MTGSPIHSEAQSLPIELAILCKLYVLKFKSYLTVFAQPVAVLVVISMWLISVFIVPNIESKLLVCVVV